MNYDINDVKELLENMYVIKTRNLEHYERNDDEVDRDYTIAQMDLIVELLKEITGATQEEIYENLGDKIEGVFWFDPQTNDPEVLKAGTKVCVMRPIDYCSQEDFVCIFGEETAKELLEEYLYLDPDGDVYIPAGTHMTYKGCDPNYNGWPVFDIHGEEFDFAGDALKLKLVK